MLPIPEGAAGGEPFFCLHFHGLFMISVPIALCWMFTPRFAARSVTYYRLRLSKGDFGTRHYHACSTCSSLLRPSLSSSPSVSLLSFKPIPTNHWPVWTLIPTHPLVRLFPYLFFFFFYFSFSCLFLICIPAISSSLSLSLSIFARAHRFSVLPVLLLPSLLPYSPRFRFCLASRDGQITRRMVTYKVPFSFFRFSYIGILQTNPPLSFILVLFASLIIPGPCLWRCHKRVV